MPTDCKRFEKSVAEEGPCRGACKTCFATLPAASLDQELLLLTAPRDDGVARLGAGGGGGAGGAGGAGGGGGAGGAGSSGAGSSTPGPDEAEIEAEVRAA